MALTGYNFSTSHQLGAEVKLLQGSTLLPHQWQVQDFTCAYLQYRCVVRNQASTIWVFSLEPPAYEERQKQLQHNSMGGTMETIETILYPWKVIKVNQGIPEMDSLPSQHPVCLPSACSPDRKELLAGWLYQDMVLALSQKGFEYIHPLRYEEHYHSLPRHWEFSPITLLSEYNQPNLNNPSQLIFSSSLRLG